MYNPKYTWHARVRCMIPLVFVSTSHKMAPLAARACWFALALPGCLCLQLAPSRPLRRCSAAAAARSVVTATAPHELASSATASLLLAVIPGLGEGYGGKSAFSQTASGQDGDLNVILLLAVIFPTVVTAYFFRDGIVEFFNPPPEEIPPGWRKEPSQSRPGKFSYVNIKTRERYDRLPNSAFID